MLKTDNMRDKEVLARQYKDSVNLDIRKNFHKKYSSSSLDYPDWILSKIGFFQGCRVLEVGCGTGSLWQSAPHLIETFSELVLTDISAGMLAIARQTYAGRENVQIQVLDVLDMPFEDNSFDIVVANSMLYHVNDVASALAGIHRILRQGGAFYATTFGKDGLLNYIQQAMFEIGLADSEKMDEISFSLENGGDILQKYFPSVNKETYDDHLEVSQPADLVDYIFSMSSMSHIDESNRARMTAYFETRKDSQGLLRIPKLYGMFISLK